MLIITQNRKPVALPLATIASARTTDTGDWLVVDAQGEQHTVDAIAWDIAVEGTPSAMVPALPGTYVVTPRNEDDGGDKVWRNNVLGWMVCADAIVRPVVISPDLLLGERWTVMHPDGRIECSNGNSWTNEGDWLAAMAEERTRAPQLVRG